MPDEVSVEDGVSQPEVTADEQQTNATKEAEEVKEQQTTDEELSESAPRAEVTAAEPEAATESTSAETAEEPPTEVAGDADAATDSAPAEAEASNSSEAEQAAAEAQVNNPSLSVDTTVDDEQDEAEITQPEPVTQPPQQQDTTLPAVSARVSLYGSQHNWCPLCSRQAQQTVESTEAKDQSSANKSDELSLSWVEQSIFACNAEHHSNITAFKSLLPPATSLPPFVPTSVSILGPPLSGRTSLAKRMCSSLGLTYLSVADIFVSLAASSHPLATQLSALLPSPPSLSLTLDCVEAALCRLTEANEGTRGWVLDGFPNTREEAEAMRERGLLPRQCINLTSVKRGGLSAEVAEVEKRWRVREEREQAERAEQERLAAERAASAALEQERKRSEQEAAEAAEEGEEAEEKAGGEAAEAAEQTAEQPAEQQTETSQEEEEAEVADEQEAADEPAIEQPAENGDEASQEATADQDITDKSTDLPSAPEVESSVCAALSVNSDGEVQMRIQPLPLTPAVPIDLLTPFVASLRTTQTAEQWSEQAAAYSQLLSYLRSERLLLTITAPTSLWSAQRQAGESLEAFAASRMAHLQAVSAALPSSLSSLPFSSTRLSTDFSGFGLYSAVSWHDHAALQKLQPDDSTTRWVQYKGLLYPLCDEQEEQKFVADPIRYHDASSFPTILPCPFTDEAGTGQLVHPMRYSGYCPVSILRHTAGEVLYVQPGSSQHSALYQSRLYRFSSADALQQFLRFPTRYCTLTLPSPLPLPLHLQPLPLTPDAVHTFFQQNFNARLATSLSTVSKQRHTLLYPGLTVQQTALVYLALQLRCDAQRLQMFESECQLGREIAKEAVADGASGSGEEADVRHAAYDAIHAEVAGKDWQSLQRYFESKYFPVV